MSFETISFGRITNSYLNQAIIGNTMKNQKKYVELNLEYSTQKKVNTLSDDPMSISKLFGAKNELSRIEGYFKNMDLNKFEMQLAESNLESMVDKDLTRISILANQASSELNGTDEANIMANEIEECLKHIINVANTNYNGKYVFAGANVNNPAYEISGNDYRYKGTTDAQGYNINMQISDNTSITLSQNGNNIFGEYYSTTVTIAGVPTITTVSYGVIGNIQELLTSLRSSPVDFDGIRSKLDPLSDDAENVTFHRTKIGSNLNIIQKVKLQLEEQEVNAESLRGDIEDANLVEVASKLQYQEYALQASLQSASKVVQNSLLNFLNS